MTALGLFRAGCSVLAVWGMGVWRGKKVSFICYAAVLPSGTKTFHQERRKKAISVSCDLVCGLLAQARHLSVLWFPYFDPAGELKVAAKFDLTHLRFF